KSPTHRPTASSKKHGTHAVVASVDRKATGSDATSSKPEVTPPPKPDVTPPPPPKPDLIPTPPPPKPDVPVAPARTPVVGATAVSKLAGELPEIRADADSGDVLAKL